MKFNPLTFIITLSLFPVFLSAQKQASGNYCNLSIEAEYGQNETFKQAENAPFNHFQEPGLISTRQSNTSQKTLTFLTTKTLHQ